MTFTIIKKGNNNFWHLFNNGAKEINLSDFQAVLDSVAQTFIIQALNGANIPQTAVGILDIIVIDETDASLEETFANVEALRTRLVELGYTPYLGAVADNITGLIEAGTNVTITGDGTTGSPYVISSSGGGGGAVDSVNGDTGDVIVDLQSVVDEGRTFTESDGTTQYDFETFTGSGVSKVFRAIVTTVASGLQSILSFSRNAFTLRVRNNINPATFNEITASGGNFDFVTQNGTTARNTLRIPTKSISGDAIYTFKSDRLAGTYNILIESVAVNVDTLAIDNTNYIAAAPSTNITFTDPSPTGSFYTVLVRNSGTATVGGVSYPSGTYLLRHRTIDPSSQWNTMVLNNAIPQTVSFTAINDLVYTANGTLTVTDPTPLANKGYIVHVIGGTSTIGGVGYTTGALVYRYYDGAIWISTNMNSAITIDATPTDGSSNAVSSNGVFDALALKADVYPNYPFNTSTNYFGLFDIVPTIVTNVVIGSTANNTNSVVSYNRFYVDKEITISDFAILQNAANDGASATVTLYVFDDSNGGLPGIKLHQEISATGILTPAQKYISFTNNLTLQKGNYWIALHFRGLNPSGTNPTFIGGLINHPNVATSIASYNTNFRVFSSGILTDLTDNPTVILGGSQNLPQIFIKM